MDAKAIQKRLQDLRKEKGWSLSEAGRRAGLNHVTVRKCEMNMEKINAGTLKNLANGYGVSTLYLCGFTESRDIPDREGFLKLLESIPSTGDRLQLLRVTRGWTARFVEKIAGLGKDSLYDLEAGRGVILHTAQSLAAIYEVPVSLIYKKHIPKPKSKDGYLKTLRLQHGMTIGEAATHCGISQATLRSYEIARIKMSEPRLEQFAQLYGVPYNEMQSHMKAEFALYVEKHPKPEKQSKREKSPESGKPLNNLSHLTILRKERKWTQPFVAEAIGVSRQRLSQYENGRAAINPKKADMLAKLFGVSADYICGKTDKRPESEKPLNNLSHLTILRKERKWTQPFVAEAIGVSRQRLSQYENGRAAINPKKADMLAKLFGVSADYICGKTDERDTYVPMENGNPENRLRLFRLLKNWTLDEVAKRSGIPSLTVSRLEKGKQKLKDDLVQKLADLYQVPASMICVPASAAVSYLDAVKMLCALQEDPGLSDLVRQCLDRPENVQKCLDILKETNTMNS